MLQWITHTSHAIKNFPMGDPHIRTFPVYLPPDYSTSRPEPYPVIFLLKGFGGRGASYAYEESAFTPSLPQQLDKAIAAGSIKPCIVVFPDGSSKLGGSQYLNSPAFGHYMDYFCDELTAHIDHLFHTHADAAHRGVAGHSSGGFGALIFGLFRPDAFSAICSSAGDSFFKALFTPCIHYTISAVEKFGGVTQFVETFLQHPNPASISRHAFEAMMTLAMAPCFAPNLNNKPLLGDLFFDIHNGEIIEEVWQRYLAWDPVHLINQHHQNFAQLKWVHLAAGLDDEYSLQWGHRQLAKKLTKYGIAHYLEEYPGGHSGQNWRYLERIRLMLEVL